MGSSRDSSLATLGIDILSSALDAVGDRRKFGMAHDLKGVMGMAAGAQSEVSLGHLCRAWPAPYPERARLLGSR